MYENSNLVATFEFHTSKQFHNGRMLLPIGSARRGFGFPGEVRRICVCAVHPPPFVGLHNRESNLCKEKNVSKTLPSSLPVILGRRSLGHWSSFYTTIKHLSTFVTTLPMSILVLFHKIIDASSSWWKFGWRNLLSLQLRWNNSENPFSFTSNDV